MDWDKEYDLVRSGRLPASNAGPSRNTAPTNRRVQFANQDVDMAPPEDEDADAEGRGRTGRANEFPEDEPTRTPLDQLMRHWMNERHCPDILPAQEELLSHLLDHLRRQVRFNYIFYLSSNTKLSSQRPFNFFEATHLHPKMNISE